MVGVRYRRALFPGYSDTVQFSIPCSAALGDSTQEPKPARQGNDGKLELPGPEVLAPARLGIYNINVALQYRKVDQFLLNFLFGETNKLTSPVTEIARATATVLVEGKARAGLKPVAETAIAASKRHE
jgi:hypothetical protein